MRQIPFRACLRMAAVAVLVAGVAGCSEGVLRPHGPVGEAEKTIFLNSLGIMLAIVVPTILATLGVAWWFRASNRRARYLPTWQYSGRIEMIVWSIPAMVILLLGGIAWVGSHDLDPPKALVSPEKAVRVEVVSLDWKWLFIYPDQGVASVNRLVVPVGVPVSFRLTSETVMNSFFVPELGSQIYTMNGMVSRLNLKADQPGLYPGFSAQFSGDGFSGMRFTVDAVGKEKFANWVEETKGNGRSLAMESYEDLAKPSKNVEPYTFGSVKAGLFDLIVNRPTGAIAKGN
ncbi:ubiquinol oxidase subunit II [Nitrospirillum sp. BR 11164]|uniref:ubiquinol oxidase subunit II n=1 Tax=Nitrospirillum sp. BR 11164 TaxID=3104324 RepID=UPI002AFF2211|nr:ubiquinol oxidase subunit II [Nitrospirillum sp. BR 11164]MEA1648489.1 ubiquinol oxidase subunit II [Nitrospirillum sp. BR 11164]